jgi:hypothetical protein
MGTSESKQLAKRPVRFGILKELGEVKCIAFSVPNQHAKSVSFPSLAVVGELGIDVFNAQTGDRTRHLLSSKPPFTCAFSKVDSCFGSIVVTGRTDGLIEFYDTVSLQSFKSIKVSNSSMPTCLHLHQSKVLFVGLNDGVVKSFDISTGSLLATYSAPKDADMPDTKSPSSVEGVAKKTGKSSSPVKLPSNMVLADANFSNLSVCAITVLESNSKESSSAASVLITGRQDGVIHTYNVTTAAHLMNLQAKSGLTQLLAMPRFYSIAAVHAGKNSIMIWDLSSDRTVVADFSAEQDSIGKRFSNLAQCAYDDSRGVVLCGCMDGNVFVRKVVRIAGTGDLILELISSKEPSVAAPLSSPAPITSIFYDSKLDLCFTGDNLGIVRLMRSGLSPEPVPTSKRISATQLDNSSMKLILREKVEEEQREAKRAEVEVAAEKVAEVEVAAEKVAEVEVAAKKVAEVEVAAEKVAEVEVAAEKVVEVEVVTEKVAEVEVAEVEVAMEKVEEVELATEKVAEVDELKVRNQQIFEKEIQRLANERDMQSVNPKVEIDNAPLNVEAN